MTAAPDTAVLRLAGGPEPGAEAQHPRLLLPACDGLWDVMSRQQVCDAVWGLCRAGMCR